LEDKSDTPKSSKPIKSERFAEEEKYK